MNKISYEEKKLINETIKIKEKLTEDESSLKYKLANDYR